VRELVVDPFSPSELKQLKMACERITAQIDAS
jgi:hypothetical protein